MDLKPTPKDSVDALRLLRTHQDWLIEPGDPVEVKEQIQGIIVTYLAAKRAGGVDAEFREWYETADLAELASNEADPTE